MMSSKSSIMTNLKVHGSDNFEVPVAPEAYVADCTEVIASKFKDESVEENGHLNIGAHDVLRVKGARVEVLDIMGAGAYGAVYKCLYKQRTKIAVKILKHGHRFTAAGEREVKILTEIGQNRAHCLTLYGSFVHQEHFCLMFELLQQSLLQLLPQYGWQLTLEEVRPITNDVATALAKLAKLGIVHGDLKPDNIMIIDHEKNPFRVKIVDFGLAHRVTDQHPEPYIQSRYYRAPEIILQDTPYSEAVDLWSMGCVLAECVAGRPLFPGRSEYDQMRYIFETQGAPDQGILNRAWRTMEFFVCDTKQPRLKTPDEFVTSLHHQDIKPEKIKYEGRRRPFANLDEVVDGVPAECLLAEIDRQEFLDLLKQLLQINPEERPTPQHVLEHPFLTLERVVEMKSQRNCADDCLHGARNEQSTDL